jgi:hypothetical protein
VANSVASSETLDIDQDALAREADALDRRQDAPAREVDALGAPSLPMTVASDALGAPSLPMTVASDALPARASRRRGGWIALAAVVLAGVVAALVVWHRGGESPAPAPTVGVSENPGPPAPTVADTPAVDPPPTPDAAVVPSASPDAGVADAAPPDADRSRDERSLKTRRKRVSPEVKKHLDAAEQARTAGNILDQMAHADSALRLAPDSPHAAYLLGDALLASDRERGCRFLRRAKRLRKARKAFARAGCARTD